MSKTESISTILKELTAAIDEKGDEAILALLRNARKISISDNDDIKFVIVSVCNQLCVSIDQMINAQSSGDTIKYAKGFIVYYLRTDFEIPWEIIKQVLKHKDQAWLYELMKLVKSLKPFLPAHQQFFTQKEKLDQTIKEYKSKK